MTDIQKIAIVTALLTAFLSYTIYLYAVLPAQGSFLSEEADRGKSIWQELNCSGCHQVYGLGGYLGPDLTNIYSLKGKNHIKAFLSVGSNTMPSYLLTDEQSAALLAYLKHLDETGNADPRSFSINYNGTIDQK